uniref:GekBS125P n=1 Tax=Gekko japonicus TaxID=146911 RepID=Q5EI26_GEKJA|nr:GekBS125P [Gekko japonicus]
MKMVAAAKYARAERDLKPARVYGIGSLALYEKADIKVPEDKKKHLIIGVSSDRGLCGAIHSSVAKPDKKRGGQSHRQLGRKLRLLELVIKSGASSTGRTRTSF